MRDQSMRWGAIPDWRDARIDLPGLAIRTAGPFDQWLVSGDLDAFARSVGLAPPVGALRVAAGDAYAVRIARDRVLAVGIPDSRISAGWHSDGYGITRLSTALQVIEARGVRWRDLVERGATIDPSDGGASALVPFAGANALLYRHGAEDVLRIHVEWGLAPYLWNWLGTKAPALAQAVQPA